MRPAGSMIHRCSIINVEARDSASTAYLCKTTNLLCREVCSRPLSWIAAIKANSAAKDIRHFSKSIFSHGHNSRAQARE